MSHSLGGVDVGTSAIRRALTDSLLDGVFATIMIALVETFGVAAAIALGVSSVPLALLGSLPVWLGTMVQLGLRRRVATVHRKPIVVRAVRTQALFLLGVAASGWAPPMVAPWLFVAGFVLHGASGATVAHLWMSWFSDICPRQVLGRHTAWRSAIFAGVQFAVTLGVGALTHSYHARGTPWAVFAAVFFVAGLARLTSSAFLARQYEPEPQAVVAACESFRPSKSLARFAAAVALFQGAALMAGPFFSVWYLRDLHFSYWAFAAVGASSVAGNLVASRFVGRLADRFGAARVLMVSALLAAFVPFPYILLHSPLQVAVANFYSGAVWAGVNVSAFKYLITASEGDVTRSGLVYANVWMTSSMLAFSLVGGLLAERLPILFTWRLQSLFAASGLLRLVIVIVLFSRLPNLDVTEAARRAGPGRFFQLFRWRGPGTTQS